MACQTQDFDLFNLLPNSTSSFPKTATSGLRVDLGSLFLLFYAVFNLDTVTIITGKSIHGPSIDLVVLFFFFYLLPIIDGI